MATHHSHSGQFCQHASGSLESMVQQAIKLGFTNMCLTEHIPRLEEESLYAEEIESNTSLEDLQVTFDKYIKEAVVMQDKYKDQIDLLIGFESESINESYFDFINAKLQLKYPFDLWLGSVHHLLGLPIDMSEEIWVQILHKLDNDVERVLDLYFEMQYKNTKALKPPIIAHFDLIRLFAPKGLIPDDLKTMPKVWEKIKRNVQYIKEIGAMVEINTAAIRKGWKTPYPQPDIAQYLIDEGIQLCMSDDSHKTEQIGLNYRPSIEYIEKLGAKEVFYLTKDGKKSTHIEALKDLPFWQATNTTS